MIIGDNRYHIRVLLYSYYTTITGWGVLLRYGFVGLRVTFEEARGFHLCAFSDHNKANNFNVVPFHYNEKALVIPTHAEGRESHGIKQNGGLCGFWATSTPNQEPTTVV